jgi:hypothetical protein
VRKLTIHLQMVVGFFAGDIDYSGVGPLFSRLSAEYPKTWFYSVRTGIGVAWCHMHEKHFELTALRSI